eukprot:m.76857 g.76857  ORF g.76857 m.76857 type:complete len:328 (-) comp13196_c0_seq1:31-1014(-)
MWLEEAAARGNSHAYVNLGWLHQIGCGAPVDYAKAREYYESTLQSDADDPAAVACALRNLGCMYEHGLGVTVSHTQARELYERASQGGDAVACVLLGLMEEESDNAHRSTISRAVHALGRSLIALADSESLLLSTHNLHNTHHQSHDAHNSADAAASQALPHRPPPSLYAHQSTLPSTGCAARFYKQAQALSGSGSGGEDLCQYGVWVLRGRGGIPASPLRAQRFFEIALLLDPASRAGHYLTVTHQLQAKKCVSTLSHTLASLLGHSNAACSAKRSAGSLSSPQCTWHSDPDCICSTLVDATSLGCVCACGAVALALMAVQRRTHE